MVNIRKISSSFELFKSEINEISASFKQDFKRNLRFVQPHSGLIIVCDKFHGLKPEAIHVLPYRVIR